MTTRIRRLVIVVALVAGACQRQGLTRDRVSAALEFKRAPVILVTIDTLRADRLGSYGSALGLTPNLDAFAREAICFDQAVAQVPLTLPSHATILTGAHPARHAMRSNDAAGGRLAGASRADGGRSGAASLPTLAEVLRAAGYRTAAFIGAAPLAGRTGLKRGFDVYEDHFLNERLPDGALREERRADEVVGAFLRGERPFAAGRPFFAWLHFYDPHTPYAPPEPYATRYADRPYDGEVAYTDAAFGRLLTALTEQHLLDRALTIVVADHGEALGDHGEHTHGTLLYEPTVHVPLLLRLPRETSADALRSRRVRNPVELADLAPTIAGLVGVGGRRWPDGEDLRPLITGAERERARPVYAESYYQTVLLGWTPLRSIRDTRWKFIDAPQPELYDLPQDPGERDNLAGRLAERARAFLTLVLQEAGTGAGPAGAAPQPSREQTTRLQSLGYASGSTAPARGLRPVDPPTRAAIWGAIEDALDRLPRDPAGAERALARALELDPENGLALKYLGDVAFRGGRFGEALGRYERAERAGFSHPDLLVNLALSEQRLGRSREAIAALERALVLDPGAADILNQLGMAYAQQNDWARARAALSRAAEAAPARPEAWYNLALADARAGQDSDAEEHLRRALSLNPAYAEAHYQLGYQLATVGRYEDALAVLREALRLKPAYPEALFMAARVAGLTGRSDEAAAAYTRFLEIAPPAYGPQIADARRALQKLKKGS